MSGVRLPVNILGVALCLLISAACLNAAIVKVDLIGGLGEFEFSADTAWQMNTDAGWPWGYKASTPNFSVAPGWSGITSYGVEPDKDAFFRIVPAAGIGGSSCQSLGIWNCGSENNATIYLKMSLPINDDKDYELHRGDTVTFRLDRIFMNAYTLPSGGWVNYKMRLLCYGDGKYNLIVAKDLTYSTKAFAAEVTAKIPADTTSINMRVEVSAGGNLGNASPCIFVDGARLYVKPTGSSNYATEQVPVPRNRTINSHMIFFIAHEHDPYIVARDYDTVMLQYESDYYYALRLKYYNPNIKVLLYEHGGAVSDWRDENLADPSYSNCPFAFSTVLAEHIDWLYPWPEGFTLASDERKSWLQDVDYVSLPTYPRFYYVHIDNPGYQQLWRETVADKVTRYRLDGVFVDSAEGVKPSSNTPITRLPVEVQSFEHGVYPYLKEQGVETYMNCAIGILGQAPACIYFDPFWKADATYSSLLGYENNTPDSTPDAFFQEWSFFKHYSVDGVTRNVYDLGYWNCTMESMEAIATWNKKLANGLKKSMHVLVDGIDRPSDPALGLDGWAHFGLCSFLLAQHEKTWFGAEYVVTNSGPIDVDLTCTSRLGKPVSGRGMLTSDKSLQMRLYKNGLVIVNGHPSEYRSYRTPLRLIDEDGNLYPKGLTIKLKPHTGRMFFYK